MSLNVRSGKLTLSKKGLVLLSLLALVGGLTYLLAEESHEDVNATTQIVRGGGVGFSGISVNTTTQMGHVEETSISGIGVGNFEEGCVQARVAPAVSTAGTMSRVDIDEVRSIRSPISSEVAKSSTTVVRIRNAKIGGIVTSQGSSVYTPVIVASHVAQGATTVGVVTIGAGVGAPSGIGVVVI